MKLNLGCGHRYLEGWINVDGPKDALCYEDLKADVHSRIEDLDYPENSVEEILMEAVFEHFPRHVAILQLRKFYKWLKPGGSITIVVPDFWGTVKMLKKSKSPKEQQFWYRHLFGPQDTIQFGVHYDAFDVEKLKWIFSVVGFDKFKFEIIKRWPSIKFTAIKGSCLKSDEEVEREIVNYMANYETKDEPGLAFGAWMDSMGIRADKPETPAFYTHGLYIRHNLLSKLKNIIMRVLK